jgi:ATP-binding cassette subfamily C (CFTR/MRP) protein 1
MVRGGLICSISEKMLTLDAANTRIDASFTLISTDVERICQSLRNMHEAWANIIELAIAIYLLARELGAASVAPVVLVAGT